jgi:hypothetical protein
MKKDQNTTIERINAHMKNVEVIVADLLARVKLSELSSRECLTMAARFLGLYQRALSLRHVCELGQPDRQGNILIASLMRQMRGEEQPQEALDLIAQMSEASFESAFEEEEDGDGSDY